MPDLEPSVPDAPPLPPPLATVALPPPPPPPAVAPAPPAPSLDGPQWPGVPAPSTMPPPRQRRRGIVIVVLAVVAVLALVGTSIAVLALVKSGDDVTWDPRIEPLAHFVERARGGPFDHAVEVRFLAEDDYVDTLQSDGEDELSGDEETDAAVLRALGWIGPDADPSNESQQLVDDGTLAYYTPDDQVITVRGEPTGSELDVMLRTTLVHELTHAWQDQHHDLNRPVEAIEDDLAFSSLVEGDATRIEDAYVESLPRSEREAYDEALTDVQDDLEAGSAGDDAPGLELVFAGPYIMGPGLVYALEADGSNARIDAAFEEPPTTTEQAMFPAVFDEGIAAAEVDAPALPDGATGIDEPVPGGAWELLTTLAGRVDPVDAVAAARAWAGGTQQTWRTADDQVCIGWAMKGDGAGGLATLRSALDNWVASGPDGVASVRTDGDVVTLTACDPGDAAVLGNADDRDATIGLAATHTGLVVTFLSDLDLPVADCVATKVVGTVDPDLLLGDDLTDEQYAELFDQAASFADACDGATVTG